MVLLASACLAAACATTPPTTTKVASANTLATRSDASPASSALPFKGLCSQSWVKDEDGKDC
jgi:hypothetical protein